jgi:hypothetical protein
MFVAAQLICPISYEDPGNLFNTYVSKDVTERMPLKDVHWRNPINSTHIHIPSLPLRFMESGAKLFKVLLRYARHRSRGWADCVICYRIASTHIEDSWPHMCPFTLSAQRLWMRTGALLICLK